MDRKVNPSVAETVASDSLMGNGLASRAEEISRVTSTAAEDEGRFVPGTLLGGRYRIIGLLGRGGMGEVYRATDLTLGQSVALKFLPEEASRNQRLLERFHGEVRVARLVSHPNVCRVYDIGEIEGMPFISMEYVDGEDLASLLLRIGRLPADKAVETARKLCAGLAAAHDRGVIHRDLKPQNIMINKRGEVVIMDFGLAAIADQLSGAEVRNGTPAYMAPEQLQRRRRHRHAATSTRSASCSTSCSPANGRTKPRRAAADRPAGIGASHQHDRRRRRHRSGGRKGHPALPRSRSARNARPPRWP